MGVVYKHTIIWCWATAIPSHRFIFDSLIGDEGETRLTRLDERPSLLYQSRVSLSSRRPLSLVDSSTSGFCETDFDIDQRNHSLITMSGTDPLHRLGMQNLSETYLTTTLEHSEQEHRVSLAFIDHHPLCFPIGLAALSNTKPSIQAPIALQQNQRPIHIKGDSSKPRSVCLPFDSEHDGGRSPIHRPLQRRLPIKEDSSKA